MLHLHWTLNNFTHSIPISFNALALPLIESGSIVTVNALATHETLWCDVIQESGGLFAARCRYVSRCLCCSSPNHS